MSKENSEKRTPRRGFIAMLGGLSAGLALTGGGWLNSIQAESTLRGRMKSLGDTLEERQKDLDQKKTNLLELERDLERVRKELGTISDGWVLYGTGTNLKYMTDPKTRQATVPLEEIWGFDKNFAFCRVENNPQAFIMPTHSLGEVKVEANSFYMVMITTHLEVSGISELPGGGAKVVLAGTLDCITEARSGEVKIGHRDKPDPAEFEIVAVDSKQKDSFAFTALFDEHKAHHEYQIFGPKFTFTGDLKTGGVVIRRIRDFASTERKQS